MEQLPAKRATGTLSTQRTQPALPGATLPTAPTVAATPRSTRMSRSMPSSSRHVAWRAALQLLSLGLLLELLLLALFPLLGGAPNTADPVQQALPGLFPWLPHLYWTTGLLPLAQLLARVPWLDPFAKGLPGIGMGNANLTLFLLILAGLLTLLATRIGTRVARERLIPTAVRALFLIVVIVAGVLGLTLLFTPVASNSMSYDMLSYGLYSRMVVLYHIANPYVLLPTQGPQAQDVLQTLLKAHTHTVAPFGPVWLDISILVSLLANNSIANMVLGFRVIGVVAHLANALLIWLILAQFKPELRISSTLLYAWNPLILLLSVYQMHMEVVLVLFVLLAIFFFQHHAPPLGWVFLLLACMMNLLCLLLLPLFFLVELKESRALTSGRRVLWWLGMLAMSALVIALAYVPYWPGWGFAGLWASVRQVFWPDVATNSLAAALASLPINNLPVMHWLAAPHHWAFLLLLLAGSALLLGMWLTSALELAVFFSAWVFLVTIILQPVYWPWYMLLPLMLALLCANRQTVLLATLFMVGALLSYYNDLWPVPWNGQALVTIGLPLLVWGWIMFFSSTWRMTHAQNDAEPQKLQMRASRSVWSSRPSWPSRPRMQ